MCKAILLFLSPYFLCISVCIKLQLNLQQTQPQYNIYRHIYIVSCILAAIPAWLFVLWLSTTLKSFVICRRENGQRNAHVFATVCKAVALYLVCAFPLSHRHKK